MERVPTVEYMLKPALDGLIIWLIIVAITLGIWIWDIYKRKQTALLLFGSVTLLSVLIFQVLDHWFNANADNVIEWLLFINLVVAIAATWLLTFLNTRHLAVSLVMVLVSHSIYHLSLRDDLKLYLTMRLSRDSPSISLYYWASRPEIRTDWKGVYEAWPDNELLLREGVMTYLLYSNTMAKATRIYQNTSFRDATFEAWAVYNKDSSNQRIDFSGSTYYEDCATNAEFMKWWLDLAVADNRHEAGFIWFLGVLKEHLEYSAEEELAQIEESLKACQASATSNSKLTGLFTELLTAIQAIKTATIE